MQRSHWFAVAVLLFNVALAEEANYKKYMLTAKGINVSVIPYGARVLNVWVPDKHGEMRDIVVGPDTGQEARENDLSNHSYFGPIIGRYANRIKNGTFTVDGKTFRVVTNENDGRDTLHGGKMGYDVRNWTVLNANQTSITFAYMDDGNEGFPGRVYTEATYSVEPYSWISHLVSHALDAPTPIMLSNHIYWSLAASSEGDNSTILDDTLWMPFSARYMEVDGIKVATGIINSVQNTALDFTRPKRLGQDIFNARSCGSNCIGYDNALIFNRPADTDTDMDPPVVSWSSPNTGIRMDLFTNQAGLQLYSCTNQNNTIRTKSAHSLSQGRALGPATIPKYGCLVLEPQDWMGALNYPLLGRDKFQVFSPTTGPAVHWAKYTFSAGDDIGLASL